MNNASEMNNVIPNLSESAQVSDLFITINGVSLRSQNMLEIQINHKDYKKGRLSFIDTYNVSEFAPLTRPIITLSWKDASDTLYKEDFIGTETEIIRLKDNRATVIVRFEEVTLNVLKSTYVSKAFSNMTMLSMLQNIFTERGISAHISKGVSDNVYEHFVFPANMSLYEFIEKNKLHSNIRSISTRKGILFTSRDSLSYGGLPPTDDVPLTLNYNSNNPFWNILEYRALSNPRNVTNAAKGFINHINASNIGYYPDTVSIEKAYESEIVNGFMGIKDKTLPEVISTIGNKEIDSLYNNQIQGDTEDYRDIINTNHDVTLAIQGLNVDRLYTRVKIDIPRPASIDIPQSDEVYSVEGVITEIIDKIMGGVFSQIITVQTSDYGKANKDTWSK